MKTVHKKRLLTLAKFLKTSRQVKDHFSLWGWVGFDRGITSRSHLNRCGSTACACGWAALIPSFNRLGFRLKDGRPAFKGSDGWDAVGSFFGLGHEDALRLFSALEYLSTGDSDSDPRIVADRIFEFVRYA